VNLRHARVGHRLDHLAAVLDGAGLLGRLADHVAGGVLQEDQRRAALVAQLDELRGLGAPAGWIGPLLPIRPTAWPSMRAWPQTVSVP
jgi:hypothetical protein